MNVLVVNTGSSSLKLSVLDPADELVASLDVTRVDEGDTRRELAWFLAGAPPVGGAGHRIVHGGDAFPAPVLLDPAAEEDLEQLGELAPLHNPPALAAVRALAELAPALPQVACFDTSFHRTLPARARTYAVPAAWRHRWPLHRYGFHGLSHAWASRRAARLLGRPVEQLRLVTAHLGAGGSLAAVSGGRSVDTTMGFTPLEGLVMATRSGSLDPGLVLWVQRHGPLSPEEVEEALERDAGLLGLSEVSGDLREVLAAADGGDPAAVLAYEVYVYRIQTQVGAMAVALGGLDALVFTGGIGENSGRLRADVCAGLEVVGLDRGAAGPAVDGAPGTRGGPGPGDAVLSGPGARPAVVVVRAREDLEIARHVRELVG